MSVAPASAARINRLSEADCAQWAARPTVNPLTGRSIEVNKGTYNAIAKRCSDAFQILPAGSPSPDPSPGPSTSQQRPPLPKTVNMIKVPQTAAEWKDSTVRLHVKGLYAACRRYGFITENYTHIAKDFIKICQILTEYEIIPAAERAEVAEIIALLADYCAPSKVMRSKGPPTMVVYYAQLVEAAIMRLLTGEPANIDVAQIRHDLLVADFNMYMHTGETEWSKKITELLIALEGLENDMVLMRADAPGDGAASDAYALPASRERSLPESLSQRRVKALKPKRRPEDPDEYYPWSATEEAAPTDRSRFRSHAKLSAVSPLAQPSPGAAPLAPLSPKKRTAILAELREACTVMKDTLSMQRFDRMNKKALQLVVRLGAKRSGAASQRCYYVKNIYTLWANAAKENQTAKDPLTREPLTGADKDQIMSKIRYLRPNAPDPRHYVQRRDPKLVLSIAQIRVNYEDIVAQERNNTPPLADSGSVGFYHLSLRRPVGRNVYLIGDLGYVPSDIELADVAGDANLTSGAVIGSIQALFDSGRLLTNNVIPYECCRIHMSKPMKYWVARTGGSPVAHRINLRRWKLMATEVYDAL